MGGCEGGYGDCNGVTWNQGYECAFKPTKVMYSTLGAPDITANLYCNCVYLYWEGCVICSIYLR